MRRGMVGCRAVGRLFAERSAQSREADFQSEVRRVRDLLQPLPNALRQRHPLPLRRGTPPRRSDAPPRTAHLRHLRRDLAPQNGAPVRLVVPWKYGFKSIKSIVKIKLTSSMPPTTWNLANP